MNLDINLPQIVTVVDGDERIIFNYLELFFKLLNSRICICEIDIRKWVKPEHISEHEPYWAIAYFDHEGYGEPPSDEIIEKTMYDYIGWDSLNET